MAVAVRTAVGGSRDTQIKGRRFLSFADELGVDRSSAYNLMKLHPERAKIIQQCATEGCWPGWKFCFEWLRTGNPTLGFAEFGASGRVNKPKSDERGTPHDLFARCDAEHGRFTCDVASSDALAKCDHHYTKEVDGLKQTWKGICWLNPPLSLRDAFAKKAYEAALDGCKVIGLFPAFTDASWFHEFASHAQIEFLRGRPQFVGPGNGYAPFGFMVCVWTRRSARRGVGSSSNSQNHRAGTSK